MISIVICSADRAKFAAIEKHYARVMGGEPYEIVGIQNPQSLAAGYNEGLARSTGEIVAFSHDDIEFLGPEVPIRLKRHLEDFDVVGVAGTDRMAGASWASSGPPHLFGQVVHLAENGYTVILFGAHRRVMGNMKALDGLFIAFRREVIEKVGWDAETFDGFHHYDVDATFRASQMGFKLAVASDLPTYHASPGTYNDDWQRSAQAFLRKHGSKLGKRQPYPYHISSIQVRTKQEALDIMTPGYWNES